MTEHGAEPTSEPGTGAGGEAGTGEAGTEAPSRYERSFPGMVGAMIVTLAVIGAFVAFRAINRDELEVEPDAIDYLPQVADIQEASTFPVAYPPELPAGWQVTRLGFDDTVGLTWSMDLLTDGDDYIAVRQANGSGGALMDEYVDENRIPGDDVQIGGALAETWESASDVDGDYGVVAEVGKTHLLVFGTASEDELEEFAASLVTSPVS